MVDAYGNIASIANGMDTKTFVELSEAFAKLAIVHQNNIKSNNVVTYLIRMAKDTSFLFSVIEVFELNYIIRILLLLLFIN